MVSQDAISPGDWLGGTRMDDIAEHRVCERATLRRAVAVSAGGASAISGTLVNVSLGGVLVEVPSGAGFAVGQRVNLRLASDPAIDSFPCTVVRARDDLLGLSVDRELAARFGLKVTRGTFTRRGAIGDHRSATSGQ